MPASNSTSVNQNSHNTMTGHSNRCGDIEIAHTGEVELFVTVVCVMKTECFHSRYAHLCKHNDLTRSHSVSCANTTRTEALRSLIIYEHHLSRHTQLKASALRIWKGFAGYTFDLELFRVFFNLSLLVGK